MTKRPLLAIFLGLFLPIFLIAQCENGQLQADAQGTISNVHRSNTVHTYGTVSYNLADNYYFDAQEDQLFYLGYSKGIWAGGTAPDGSLKVSTSSFPTLSRHDFIPGPLDRTTGLPTDTACGVYNRVWTLTQFEVSNHQLQFKQGTLNEEDIPLNLLEWPAKGNPYLGDLAPQNDLAPFHDVAEDDIYNPLDGDYPLVLKENPEFIASEFSFIVYNDVTPHTWTSLGQPMHMEFQQMNYVLNCPDDAASNHSVFTRINYVYLGQEDLTDFRLALFEDNDLACNVNDYTGCSRDLNCSFFYNAGGESWTDDCHDPDVPDDNGAIRSTVFFNQDLKAFRHFYLNWDTDVATPPAATFDPGVASEYYNYLFSKWKDGSSMVVGGDGYDPNSTETTEFSFPDRPDDPDGWSMQTAEIPFPRDVRALTTLVDESVLSPGATGTLDFADHFLYDTERKKLDAFEVWPDHINKLKEEFAGLLDSSFSCGGTLDICNEDCVWPGDADDNKIVDGKDGLLIGLMAGNDFENGIPRSTQSADWFGFSSDPWTQELGSTNAKYGDVNGNGVINDKDLTDMEGNFGISRDGKEIFQKILVPVSGGNQLVLELEEEELDMSTADMFDQIIDTDVFLAGSSSSMLDTPIHGLSFNMRYDTNMITPFVRLQENVINQRFQYQHAYLYNAYTENSELLGDNKIQYVFTNHNGVDVTEGGRLVNQSMFVKDDAATSNPDGRDTLVIKFYNVCAVTAAGEELPMGAAYDTLILTNLVVDPDVISSTKQIETTDILLQPNPTSGILMLTLPHNSTVNIQVMDMDGRLLSQQKREAILSTQLDVSILESGMYFLRVVDEKGTEWLEKFMKI